MKIGILVLLLIVEEEFSVLSLSVMFTLSFLHMAYIMLRSFPSIPTLLSVVFVFFLIMKGC